MKEKYEGEIGGYSFFMKENNNIEVWENMNSDHPISFIYLRDGDVRDEKDFHYEIMAWVAKNKN
jgi:hypothetical protein